MRLLWLDDMRSPFLKPWTENVKALLYNDYADHQNYGDVVWVKSYAEFVNHILEHGLPDVISFDHDLADEHYHNAMYKGVEEYNKLYDTFEEKTGYDCAKWLVEHCEITGMNLPELLSVHSQNPVGKKNIELYFANYRKHKK